jgi:general secretion pathway protein E/type IV pilus assembly protein PilB
VFLIGEIRDGETAEMALSAAMTGHQVYSTLHTNSAIGAIPRLLDIGILPDLLAGNIIGIIAPRLIRKLCVHCKEPFQADDMERRLLGLNADEPDVTIYRAIGCSHCEHQGYKGRLAIMELLKLNGDLDDLIARRATTRELRSQAMANGFRPLVEDGVRRVLDGSSSLDEISRVVDLTERLG